MTASLLLKVTSRWLTSFFLYFVEFLFSNQYFPHIDYSVVDHWQRSLERWGGGRDYRLWQRSDNEIPRAVFWSQWVSLWLSGTDRGTNLPTTSFLIFTSHLRHNFFGMNLIVALKESWTLNRASSFCIVLVQQQMLEWGGYCTSRHVSGSCQYCRELSTVHSRVPQRAHTLVLCTFLPPKRDHQVFPTGTEMIRQALLALDKPNFYVDIVQRSFPVVYRPLIYPRTVGAGLVRPTSRVVSTCPLWLGHRWLFKSSMRSPRCNWLLLW